MQNPQSQEINKRFFGAIDELIKRTAIQGRKTFAPEIGTKLGQLSAPADATYTKQ